jgi:hypothetical protein
VLPSIGQTHVLCYKADSVTPSLQHSVRSLIGREAAAHSSDGGNHPPPLPSKPLSPVQRSLANISICCCRWYTTRPRHSCLHSCSFLHAAVLTKTQRRLPRQLLLPWPQSRYLRRGVLLTLVVVAAKAAAELYTLPLLRQPRHQPLLAAALLLLLLLQLLP